MVQQQSFKLHVHILIQLFFFPRQAVWEMINTKTKGKQCVISHNAARKKKRIVSETWEKKNKTLNKFFFQVLRNISKQQSKQIRNEKISDDCFLWCWACLHPLDALIKKRYYLTVWKMIELCVSCFLKQPLSFLFFFSLFFFFKSI